MAVSTRDRLPGIYFQTVVPAPPEALPRMDVAAFVGFASCGPLNIPVLVEDIVRFHDVFGEHLPLAWDSERGETLYAHLAPAVEAFFRNGGIRCWVVRVAEEPVTNTYAIPGLINASNGRRAIARARCAGSWSDALRIGAILQSETSGFSSFSYEDNAYTLNLTNRNEKLDSGTLVCLNFEDELQLFLKAEDVLQSSQTVRITSSRGIWARSTDEAPEDLTGSSARIESSSDLETDLLLTLKSLTHTETGYDVRVDPISELDPQAASLVPGALLAISFSDGRDLWLSIEEVNTVLTEDSPPEHELQLVASESFWPLSEAEVPAVIAEVGDTVPGVKILTIELLVWDGQEIRSRLPGLAFNTPHSRSWTNLRIDDDIFAVDNGSVVLPEVGTLAASTYEPRFPIAGPIEVDEEDFFIPFGMSNFPDIDQTEGRIRIQNELSPLDEREPTALERNGLGSFSSGLFLDPDLATARTHVLLQNANNKLYQLEQPLTGMHSLFEIEEITLLAVPDSMHQGWERAEPPEIEIIPAPEIILLEFEAPDLVSVFWTSVSTGDGVPITYTLERDVNPDFTSPTRYESDESTVDLLVEDLCARRYYYRVRANKNAQFSAWSATQTHIVPEQSFDECAATPLIAPVLTRLETPEGSFIQWSHQNNALAYTIEEAEDPAFLTAESIIEEGGLESFIPITIGEDLFWRLEIDADRIGLFYLRVRALHAEEIGPWSNTVAFYNVEEQGWTLIDSRIYDLGSDASRPSRQDLISVHRAMIRFCAGRADILALLSVPRHFRKEATEGYVALLTPDPLDDTRTDTGTPLAWRPGDPSPLNLDEDKALTYAAIYHPWLASRQGGRGGSVIFSPPDGDIAGMIAARTVDRGAWIAPANVPLRGVLSLDPTIDRDALLPLWQRQINVVHRDPRGFILLSEDTLSPRTDLRPIHVRLLMILLRRLALREGFKYVFESNNADLRRRIYYHFDAVLSSLYRKGAFAGNTTAEAYQVVTGETVNTNESIERGQLFVELRVAPSESLSFLTVRLIQLGTEGFEAREV